MAGAVQSKAYKRLMKSLTKVRIESGRSQASLAEVLGRPASFVGKYELGERRLDVIELFVILKALDYDPFEFLTRSIDDLPDKLT